MWAGTGSSITGERQGGVRLITGTLPRRGLKTSE